jgi:hypothetical protein
VKCRTCINIPLLTQIRSDGAAGPSCLDARRASLVPCLRLEPWSFVFQGGLSAIGKLRREGESSG